MARVGPQRHKKKLTNLKLTRILTFRKITDFHFETLINPSNISSGYLSPLGQISDYLIKSADTD
jgi:hypothetical protein